MNQLRKRILRNLAISSAAALVTPVFFSLLSQDQVTAGQFGKVLIISAVFANAITFLADATLPRLHCQVANQKPAVQWTVLVIALVTVSTVGCVLGASFFAALNVAFPESLFPWSVFWREFAGILKLCIFITLVFGLSIATYEHLRERLVAAELKLRTEELERERAIKLATEARLSSLQARIHPHFLFNTLNSISSLIPVDPNRAERLIERMAALLRFSLDVHQGGLVPFEQELRIVHDYLEIEKARLGHRLRYGLEAGEQVGKLAVPPLSVQTLVENSIKYAVAPKLEGGEIRVRAEQNNGYLRIDVEDTGSGFSLESAPSGHGLDTLRGQLAVLFGNAAELSVSHSEGWNRVRLKVPV